MIEAQTPGLSTRHKTKCMIATVPDSIPGYFNFSIPNFHSVRIKRSERNPGKKLLFLASPAGFSMDEFSPSFAKFLRQWH